MSAKEDINFEAWTFCLVFFSDRLKRSLYHEHVHSLLLFN